MGRSSPRRATWPFALAALLALAACAAPVGTDRPPTASPPASPPSSPPSSPSAAPATSEPTRAPTPPPTATPTCPPVDFATFVASDRLSDMNLVPGTAGDLVGFTLEPSPGSPVRPRLTVKSVAPPFTYGGSGLPLEVLGEHHVRLRFEGMSHVDAAGAVIYRGPQVSTVPGTPFGRSRSRRPSRATSSSSWAMTATAASTCGSSRTW